MLLVVAILGVLAASVAVVVSSAQSGATLRRAGEDAQVFCQAAMAQAAVTQSPVAIRVQPGESHLGYRRIGIGTEPIQHRLPKGVRLRAVRVNGQVIADRSVQILVQPSGYLGSFGVLFGRGEQQLWLNWDAESSQWSMSAVEGRD